MTSPLILSLPDMNSRWALALPATRLPKSDSERERVTVAGASHVSKSIVIIEVPEIKG